MSDAPSSLQNASWVSLSLVVARATAFATTVIAARILSIEDLATYLVAVTAAVLVIPVADAGMWQVVARRAARSSELAPFTMSLRAARVRLPVWIVGCLIGAVVTALTGSGGTVIATVAIAAIAQVNLDAMTGEQFARNRFRSGALLRIIPPMIALIGTAILAVTGASSDAALAVFAISRLVPAVVLFVVAHPKSSRDTGLTLRAGLPFALLSIAIGIYTRSDVILLQRFHESALIVAQYALAYNVLSAMQTLPTALESVLFPRISAGHEDAPAQRQTALKVSAMGTTVAALIGCVAFCVPSYALFAFGGTISDTAALVAPLFLTIVPITTGQIMASALAALDQERTVLLVVVAAGVGNVVGNAVLIPHLGVRGALASTLTAESVISLVGTALVLRRRPQPSEVIGIGLLIALPLVGLVTGSKTAVLAMTLCGLAIVWSRDVFGARAGLVAVGASVRPRAGSLNT